MLNYGFERLEPSGGATFQPEQRIFIMPIPFVHPGTYTISGNEIVFSFHYLYTGAGPRESSFQHVDDRTIRIGGQTFVGG